jgi:hypothetical protein
VGTPLGSGSLCAGCGVRIGAPGLVVGWRDGDIGDGTRAGNAATDTATAALRDCCQIHVRRLLLPDHKVSELDKIQFRKIAP